MSDTGGPSHFSTSFTSIRNLAIIAHINAGKTSLSEALLYLSGAITHPGEVDDGTTETDYLAQERERGISIVSSAITFHWQKALFQLIDTPGHVDFMGEVDKGLSVADNGILIIDAMGGYQAQTEHAYEQARLANIPIFVFLNKLDKPFSGELLEHLAQFSDKARVFCSPLYLPFYDPEGGFLAGAVSIIDEYLTVPNFDEPSKPNRYNVPVSFADDVKNYRGFLRQELTESLINTPWPDRLSDWASSSLERLQNSELSQCKDIIQVLIQTGSFIAVICGSAKSYIGVHSIMDAIVQYGRPTDWWQDTKFHLEPTESVGLEQKKTLPQKSRQNPKFFIDSLGKGQLCGLSFSVNRRLSDERLVALRIYQGTLRPPATVFNTTLGKQEKVKEIFRLEANRLTPITEASAGMIVAAAGMSECKAWQTLVGTDGLKKAGPGLMKSKLYQSLMTISLEADKPETNPALVDALKIIADEDPSFYWKYEESIGCFRASGVGELQLEVALRRIQDEFRLRVSASKPTVIFREEINGPSIGYGSFKDSSNSDSTEVEVVVSIQPSDTNQNNWLADSFESTKADLVVLADHDRSGLDSVSLNGFNDLSTEKQELVKAACYEMLDKGLFGYASIENVIIDRFGFLTQSPEASSEAGRENGSIDNHSLKTACYMAIQSALKKAKVNVFEPVLRLELEVPSEASNGVVADLNRRDADINAVFSVGGRTKIQAQAAVRELLGFTVQFRSSTRGRGQLTMQYAGYQELSK